ncbi:hypothetical protein CLV90_1191 [Maribacter spongiicola]|uniref:Membrane metalloprotease n=1 Tax=Maribacter spongiicola TaxID=1206753 RepID=A0A4R7K7R8_9FLAO|nr:hypothetical protein [Maribacter spongiicola]TDT47120.1 hypothetical protein CLV90_1191 [Maribacter spongiicola]
MNKFKSLLLIGIVAFTVSCSKSSSDSDGENSEAKVDKAANLLATGDSANDILSNDTYDKLLIEIAYVTGFKPTEAAMTDFTAYLKEHTFKEDIELVYKELSSPSEDELTLQEIADLETSNRTAFNTGSTLAIYIYFADAPAEGDDLEGGLVTLGAVYRNTSMVIHEATVRDLASLSSSISEAEVETTTLNHEFGHLFGLVNLGSDMVNDHESESENEDGQLVPDNHCNQAVCLMRAELQFGGSSGKSLQSNTLAQYEDGVKSGCRLSGTTVLSLLQQQHTAKTTNTVALDAECVLDIQANGGR